MGKKATPNGGPRAKKRNAINVFIGWSEEKSKVFANELADWLELFFPKSQIKVFMSERNIAAGQVWPNRLIRELRNADFGVLCWTHTNVQNEWLLFEAGALAMSLGQDDGSTSEYGLVNLLLDINVDDLADPIRHFQNCSANIDGARKLVRELNTRFIAFQLDGHEEKKLDTLFENFWQTLSGAIDRLAQRKLVPITEAEFVESERRASRVLAYNFTLDCEVGEFDASKGMSSGTGYLWNAVSKNLSESKPYHYILAQPTRDELDEWIDELTKQIVQFVETLSKKGLKHLASLAKVTVMSAPAPINLLSLDIHKSVGDAGDKAFWWIESDSSGNVDAAVTETGWMSSDPDRMQVLWDELVAAAEMFGQTLTLLDAGESPEKVKAEFLKGRKLFHQVCGTTSSSNSRLRSRFMQHANRIRTLEHELWDSVREEK